MYREKAIKTEEQAHLAAHCSRHGCTPFWNALSVEISENFRKKKVVNSESGPRGKFGEASTNFKYNARCISVPYASVSGECNLSWHQWPFMKE